VVIESIPGSKTGQRLRQDIQCRRIELRGAIVLVTRGLTAVTQQLLATSQARYGETAPLPAAEPAVHSKPTRVQRLANGG
jgi:hypothetical protein